MDLAINLSVIIPVYGGAGTIRSVVESIFLEVEPCVSTVEVVLVNDCSPDNAHNVIQELLSEPHGPKITYIRLAKNFGEHNAVMCGLRHATGDVTAIIDDDFQNPPSEILKLLIKLEDGYDVVYSKYEAKQHSQLRNLGSWFNDVVAGVLLNKPSDIYLSSFKVINRFVIDAVVAYTGPYPYLDGLILRSTRSISTEMCAHYARDEGESSYTIRKLISLWLSMSTSFSVLPLRLAAYLGFFMSSVGFLLALFFLISWSVGGIFADDVPRGWASLIIISTIFSGIQLLVLGIIGEYLGRVFMTQNGQPQYVIREVLGGNSPCE